jgi:hypothetical protein
MRAQLPLPQPARTHGRPTRPLRKPSAFGEGGATLVGRAARGQPAATTYYSVKRVIGRGADDPIVEEEAGRLAYEVRAPPPLPNRRGGKESGAKAEAAKPAGFSDCRPHQLPAAPGAAPVLCCKPLARSRGPAKLP